MVELVGSWAAEGLGRGLTLVTQTLFLGLLQAMQALQSHMLLFLGDIKRRVTTVVNALAIFGDIWRYLAIFGDIWRYLAIFGDIWRYLAIFGSWCLKLSYMAPEGPGRST